MVNLNYKNIYGIDLKDYCEHHNTTVDALLEKIRLDIELLSKQLTRVLDEPIETQDDLLLSIVYNLIKKKETHYENLVEWKLDQE